MTSCRFTPGISGPPTVRNSRSIPACSFGPMRSCLVEVVAVPRRLSAGANALPATLDLAQGDASQVLYGRLYVEVALGADIHSRIHPGMEADALDLHLTLSFRSAAIDASNPPSVTNAIIRETAMGRPPRDSDRGY